jgi:tetratricopeptide (TPR) repeat protein/anti-sigma regulatory factor (Ser/Thr protein kinase)
MAETGNISHALPRPSDRIEPASKLAESAIEAARLKTREGDAALLNGDLSTAQSAYEAALLADAADIRALHTLGVVAYRQGKWDVAQSRFQACLEHDSLGADFHFQWGLCALKLGKEADAERAFSQSIACDAHHFRARFQLALIFARGAAPGSDDRQKAVAQLDAILLACEAGAKFESLDRVCFLLASLLDDFPNYNQRAIDVYRRGLEVDSLFAPGHNNLGVLLMKTGQILPALGEFKIAIQLEPDYTLPYGNFARLLFHHMSSTQMATEFANITDEFGPQAPSILSRLSLELIDLGRAQVYESLYTHGHRIKNLMGLSGSRMRRTLRKLPDGAPGLADLQEITEEQEQVYHQWVAYLRSMKQEAMSLTLVNVVALIQAVVASIQARAGQKGVSFAAENKVPQVKADAGMLSEAVTNLALNAIDAVSSDGEVVIQVGTDGERNSVYIEVEDNGPGIPGDLQQHIFDPGFSTREHGNGYGLSICSRIVDAHRGTLRLISQEGAGAVFRIDLPIDFEVSSDEDIVGLQRALTDTSRGPIAEEFVR